MPSPDLTDWIDAQLASLAAEGLSRGLSLTSKADDSGDTRLDFSTNDYLALARDPQVIEAGCAALREWGGGATGSRLMSGSLPVHAEAETALAEWLSAPAALLFGSGFLANLGVLSALTGPDAVVFEDRLNHASLLDGVRFSGARRVRYRHGDAEHLRTLLRRHGNVARRWVVTDTLFSMDGDVAPLAAIGAVCTAEKVPWIADEAHAFGVYGPGGRGCCAAAGVVPDLRIGTFSKAFGSYGGFVVCSTAVRAFLINRARAFIFTTAPAPACVGAAMGALRRVRAEAKLGERLRDRARCFRAMLRSRGLEVPSGDSPIIPIRVGDNHRALAVAEWLRERGIFVVAVRPPTVPRGTARLRLSVTLAHHEADLARAADAMAAAMQSVPPTDVTGVRE